jgi:2'-5' RNA ligase
MSNDNFGSPRRDSYYKGGRKPYPPRYQQKPKRPPLPEGFSLFYMALLCPENIEAEVKGFKDYMFETYGSKAAAKSPAHITVVPPFRAEDELAPNLLDFVTTFNMGMVPIDIMLSGYGNFGERVLYVDVVPNDHLTQLEVDCMKDFSQQFPSIIFGLKPPFNPHVTIATRDIPEGKLAAAKQYFETTHPYQRQFTAKELKVLKLESGTWKVL